MLRLSGRMDLYHAAALFHFTKSGVFQHVVHALKYEGRHTVAKMLGTLAGKMMIESHCFKQPDLIIPIPVHNKRRRIRGYNQSEVFGGTISKSIGIPQRVDVLMKPKNIESQTKANRIERIQNVYNSFHLYQDKLKPGASVLLVDDIITTGATLEAAYHKLKQIPDIQIQILVMGMAHD